MASLAGLYLVSTYLPVLLPNNLDDALEPIPCLNFGQTVKIATKTSPRIL